MLQLNIQPKRSTILSQQHKQEVIRVKSSKFRVEEFQKIKCNFFFTATTFTYLLLKTGDVGKPGRNIFPHKPLSTFRWHRCCHPVAEFSILHVQVSDQTNLFTTSLALTGLNFISHLRAWNLIFLSILADSQQRQLRESSLALIPQHNNTVDAIQNIANAFTEQVLVRPI